MSTGIVKKINPIGIDVVISNLQESIYESLIDYGWSNYTSYHRSYKTIKNVGGGYIPEAYTESGNYEDVLLNDSQDSTSFFVVGNTTPQSNGNFTTDLGIIFQVNLENLYSNIDHRADEEAKNDVVVAIRDTFYRADITNVVTHVPDVYAEFEYNNLVTDDLQPYFVFRVNLNVNVNYDCNYNCKYPSSEDGEESTVFQFVLGSIMN